MLRACTTIAAVAVISAALLHLRDAQGQIASGPPSSSQRLAWVRTVDGWEPSRVLERLPQPAGPPAVDPKLIALLQLGLSVFALLALPSKTQLVRNS